MTAQLSEIRKGWSRCRAGYAANGRAEVYRRIMRWTAEEYAQARGWMALDGSQYTQARIFRVRYQVTP